MTTSSRPSRSAKRAPAREAAAEPEPAGAPEQPTAEALLAEAPRVRALLRRKGVAQPDLDDMVATVMLGAVTSLRRYVHDPVLSPESALRRWMAGIARNVASHYREGRWFKRPRPLDVAELAARGAARPDPERGLEAREELARVLARLSELPARDREAFVAHDVEGKTLREIRAETRSSISALSRRVRRVRAALADARRRGRARVPRARRHVRRSGGGRHARRLRRRAARSGARAP